VNYMRKFKCLSYLSFRSLPFISVCVPKYCGFERCEVAWQPGAVPVGAGGASVGDAASAVFLSNLAWLCANQPREFTSEQNRRSLFGVVMTGSE
jgi:hypothetical protein